MKFQSKFQTLFISGLAIACTALLQQSVHAQVTFDSSFECGNATGFTETSPGNWEFRMDKDTNSTDSQWFYYEVQNAAGQTLDFTLLDTDETNVTGHWNDAVPVFSTDGGVTFDHLSTTPSTSPGEYHFTHTFSNNAERIAFHFPYPYSQFEAELPGYVAHPDVTHEILGQSIEGRDIHYLRISDASSSDTSRLAFWIVARLHAAEVTGSFKMDGFLQFITSNDPSAVFLRKNAIVHIAPFANPDGVTAGNYRDNAAGINLNRVWNGSANMTDSPEVRLIQDKIEETITNGDGDYVFFADLHSTSGANPHFAFHANSSQEPPLYATPSTYHTDCRRYLSLVRDHAPHFNRTQGASASMDTRLAYHSERINRGILAFTFEGGYIRQYSGPNSSGFMTPAIHRQIGEGIGRALVDYYELDQIVSSEARWISY